jgi:hypothetical protein
MEQDKPDSNTPDLRNRDAKTNPATFPSFFRKFKQAPFDVVDQLSLRIPLLHSGKFFIYLHDIEWNFIKRSRDVRNVVLVMALALVPVWFLLGFDSSQSQIEFVLTSLPAYLMGKITFQNLQFIWQDQYGKGMHYSAWIIYGLMFWYLSRYYSKLKIEGSRNFGLCFAFVLLSVASFETFWHYSFAIFQNQIWVIRWMWPQMKILLENLSFFILGFSMILVMYVSGRLISLGTWKNMMVYWKPNTNFPVGYRLRFDRLFWILLAGTLVCIAVWIDYGNLFTYQQLTVEVIGSSPWTSSPYFPQTVYTVETNILDNINAGDQFWIQNDLLHGINTLTKIVFTLVFVRMGMIRKHDVEINN